VTKFLKLKKKFCYVEELLAETLNTHRSEGR
jgi:hypothetical protein